MISVNCTIRVDQADGTYVSSVYNANGTLANSTDARGNTTYYGYDGLNRQTAQWSPVGAGLFEYSGKAYDKAGRAVTASRARGTVANGVLPTAWLVTTSYAYNAGGQLEQVTTSGGAKTTYTYDDNGNLLSKNMYYTSSSYYQETYQYNNMDRLWTKTTYADYRDIYGYNWSTLDLALTQRSAQGVDTGHNTAFMKCVKMGYFEN